MATKKTTTKKTETRKRPGVVCFSFGTEIYVNGFGHGPYRITDIEATKDGVFCTARPVEVK